MCGYDDIINKCTMRISYGGLRFFGWQFGYLLSAVSNYYVGTNSYVGSRGQPSLVPLPSLLLPISILPQPSLLPRPQPTYVPVLPLLVLDFAPAAVLTSIPAVIPTATALLPVQP